MAENTGILWTDNTWNPWQGCHKVSPGCMNCYMYRDKNRYGQDPATVIRSKPATFNLPLKWKEPAKVFICSWSDFFIEEADPDARIMQTGWALSLKEQCASAGTPFFMKQMSAGAPIPKELQGQEFPR